MIESEILNSGNSEDVTTVALNGLLGTFLGVLEANPRGGTMTVDYEQGFAEVVLED